DTEQVQGAGARAEGAGRDPGADEKGHRDAVTRTTRAGVIRHSRCTRSASRAPAARQTARGRRRSRAGNGGMPQRPPSDMPGRCVTLRASRLTSFPYSRSFGNNRATPPTVREAVVKSPAPSYARKRGV